MRRAWLFVVMAAFGLSESITAQNSSVIVEGGAARCPIFSGHGMVTGSARFFVLERLAIGPEIVGELWYNRWTMLANATFDFRRAASLMPYAKVGGGFSTSDRGFSGRTTSTAFTGGIGVRLPVGRHMFVAPEFRILVEESGHPIVGVVVGWRTHRGG